MTDDNEPTTSEAAVEMTDDDEPAASRGRKGQPKPHGNKGQLSVKKGKPRGEAVVNKHQSSTSSSPAHASLRSR